MSYRITNLNDTETIIVEGKVLGPNQSTTIENLTNELRSLQNQGVIAVDTATGSTKYPLTLRYTNGVPSGVEDPNGNYLGDLVLAKRSPSDGGMILGLFASPARISRGFAASRFSALSLCSRHRLSSRNPA